MIFSPYNPLALRMRYKALALIPDLHWIPYNYRILAGEMDCGTQSVKVIERHIEDVVRHGRCVVTSGPVGCGKTFAMYYGAALMLMLYDAIRGRMINPHIVTGPELVEASFDSSDWRYMMHETPMLCIDDLGAEYTSEKGWHGGKVAELIDRRYTARLPTLITTNLHVGADGNQITARYGLRTTSRLGDKNWGVVYQLTDKSLRGA